MRIVSGFIAGSASGFLFDGPFLMNVVFIYFFKWQWVCKFCMVETIFRSLCSRCLLLFSPEITLFIQSTLLCHVPWTWSRLLAIRERVPQKYRLSLQWRHNGHDSVSNYQPHDCLLNRLFRRRSKKTSKLRVTGLCAGNSPETGELNGQ